MKKILLSLTLAAATVTASHAQLVVTEVMSSSAHGGGTNNADWFELTNTGLIAFDLTNYSWDDDSATVGSANFGPITSIAAGQSIAFTAETLGDEASWISDWGLSGVTVVHLGGTVFQNFGSGGDEINIYDASNALVLTQTFGAATQGFSFEWDQTNSPLGLSVIGENGAFQAVSNGQTVGNGPGVDVGSPGFAPVPEPSTYVLIGIGLTAMLIGIRRKRTTV
jgi:hypothetical protein